MASCEPRLCAWCEEEVNLTESHWQVKQWSSGALEVDAVLHNDCIEPWRDAGERPRSWVS